VLRLQRAQFIGPQEALLLAVGLLVVPAALLLAEAGLALAQAGDVADGGATSIDRLHRYSESLGWEPRPGRYVEEGRAITINSRSYRGEPVQARPGMRRALVLGDSIAFGLYVDDHETYAARLAALAGDLEVANLAVQGYGPGQSLLRLEGLGFELEPDVVVLGLCLGNDFADAMLESFLYDSAHPKPYFRIEDGSLVRYDAHLRLGARRRLALWLQDNSRLFRTLAGSPAGEPGASWTQRRREAMRAGATAIELVGRLVLEMRARAEARGARFLVVLHPDQLDIGRLRDSWDESLLRLLRSQGVEALDLESEYEKLGLRYEELAIDTIGHLNPRGHEITASILEARLRGAAASPQAELALRGTASRPLR
jgi:hypothetical protein